MTKKRKFTGDQLVELECSVNRQANWHFKSCQMEA